MEHASGVIGLVGQIVGLLLIAAGALALTKRIRLPFTVLLVVVGIVLSLLAEHGPAFLRPLVAYDIAPDVILYVFLPTLIFESAFNLDAQHLRENLAPVLVLAAPGLLLSTALIGGIVALATPIELPAALLLGAILSATDPVAVIALFKQLGAPKRLTVLVEGESLFNDATAIVAARIILGVALAGYLAPDAAFRGALAFFAVFFGGVVVGWVAAVAIGYLVGLVEDDPFIEISLTTILAYFSFLIAEQLHVSGVMATVAAGVTMGGWGRAKISPSVTEYVAHFWEYLAYVANALIFLLVGLRVELGTLGDAVGLLGWVVLAMLVSRALVIYGLVPLLGKLPGAEPINWRYQTVMFWGGLRGAIALAIVLSLTEFEDRDIFVALVTGSVLFTLLVQGLTMETLVRWLGLDQPPLSDRLARAEGVLSAKHRALERIPELESGGLFSARIAERLRERCEGGMQEMRRRLDELRSQELDRDMERRLLFLRCFAVEKTLYYQMFARAHLSEGSYRGLSHSIELQTDAIRHEGRVPEYTLHPPGGGMEDTVVRALDRVLGFTQFPERMRTARTARDYEVTWGRVQGSARVLEELDALGREEAARTEVVDEIRAYYRYWHENARERLDTTAAQFPEFVGSMQERLAERLLVHAEREAIEEAAHAGTIPTGVAEKMLEELATEIRELRAADVGKLRVQPGELLRKVPFFRETPEQEFQRVADRLRPHTAPTGETIIHQGESGDSLFLIARGVVRVSREEDGEVRALATLLAGDFFGEMALLHAEPRTATCRAVTPCALYELRREDLDAVRAACPAIQAALEAADRERRRSLREL